MIRLLAITVLGLAPGGLPSVGVQLALLMAPPWPQPAMKLLLLPWMLLPPMAWLWSKVLSAIVTVPPPSVSTPPPPASPTCPLPLVPTVPAAPPLARLYPKRLQQ